MNRKMIRIGTRDSQLALWQAIRVQEGLRAKGFEAELVPLKSDGDIDLVTPLYEMGVQGIFTRTLDAALLAGKIDLAVHSMKDVPTQPARGIRAAAVLERGNPLDVLVPKAGTDFLHQPGVAATIATSSTRRKAQWLHRYPAHQVTNLRGNVNTRLRKLSEEPWHGAIFAAAGLERTGLLPANAVPLHWMLPAPAQGAILVVCREADEESFEIAALLNHAPTALCTQLERDFLRGLMGGCSTPISAYAEALGESWRFRGNIFAPDGSSHESIELEETDPVKALQLGKTAAAFLLERGAMRLLDKTGHHG